jgi:hypothetical protein
MNGQCFVSVIRGATVYCLVVIKLDTIYRFLRLRVEVIIRGLCVTPLGKELAGTVQVYSAYLPSEHQPRLWVIGGNN